MYKTLAFLTIIVFPLTSCDYLDGMIRKDSHRIDFTSVDEYPLFPSCDSLATLEMKEICFEEKLVASIKNSLEKKDFVTSKSSTEAIIIHVQIDNHGKAKLQDLETSSKIKEMLPELEHSIRESIDSLPTLIPAKKRGNFVNSKYMIPLYIVE